MELQSSDRMDMIRVDGCPLCDIFNNKELKSKLYYPESKDGIESSEFVVVDCVSCNIPMVVYGEHLTSVTSEAWGRILYQCRKIFGNTITLKPQQRTIRDHIHWHIYNIKRR